MKHHDLKTDGPVFQAVLEREKTHEIRFNDRDFQVGDTFTLHETKYTGEEMRERWSEKEGMPVGEPLIYTGRTIGPLLITDVLGGYGIAPGWVELSFPSFWESIETAPKDGRHIMLGYFLEAGGGGPPVVAFWHSTAQLWCHVHGYLRADGYFSPTHWMPLPSAPAGWDPEVGTMGELFKKKETGDV